MNLDWFSDELQSDIILDPRYVVLNNKLIYDWRYALKKHLLKKRGYKSDLSGKPLTESTGCHMHEGIVTRAMAPKSLWWHYLIFSEYNCFLLLPEEHIPRPPSREECIRRSFELYGHAAVKEWFDSLPFKNKPFIME